MPRAASLGSTSWSACPRASSSRAAGIPVSIRLEPRESQTVELRLRADRWGAYVLGDVLLRGHDTLGVFRFDQALPRDLELRVFPREEYLRTLLRPRDTQPYAGDEVARRRGDGIEFADIRPFAFGDQVTRVNWRATARRGELWVNDRHPERNTDIVLFLDAFTEARRGNASTLDLALRAAATLARGYVGAHDRVGLVSFGGALRWLQPGTGEAQLYRICEALLDTQILQNYAWRDIAVVPARVLRPQSLVVALTPLLDERSIGALFDLRARGHDVTVIEASPVPYMDPGHDSVGTARVPPLAAATRRAAGPAAPERHRSRRVAGGDTPGSRDRGGERIQAPRIGRPRLSIRWPRLSRATGSLACACALAAYPAVGTSRLAWMLATIGVIAVATLAAGLGLGRAQLIVWALVLLGADYAVWLELGTHALDQRAPIVAAGLLLTAELAFDSLEPEIGTLASTAVLARAIALAVVILASVGIGAVVLAASSIPLSGGIALTGVGVVAAVCALALIARLATARH